MITIYTDGACSGNGNENATGGFGVVVVKNDTIIDAYQEFSENTTNNREEMKAILWALNNYGAEDKFKDTPYIPKVYSDSGYCVNTFTKWMYSWAKNGWIKSDKKQPLNLDLILQYYNNNYIIKLHQIKGHAGNKYNEIADGLATGKIKVEDIIDGQHEIYRRDFRWREIFN